MYTPGGCKLCPPQVTAVCPIVGRAKYLPMVIDSFLSQTYEFNSLELLIVEDGGHVLENLIPQSEQIRYIHLEGKRNTGAKRNISNSLAWGEIICHFDSDDFSCRERIAQQVKFLTENKRHMAVGFSDVLYYRESDGGTFKYKYSGRGAYSVGTALCYYKDYWAENRFTEKEVGEDLDFVLKAQVQGVLASTESRGMIVALASPDSVAKNIMGGASFPVENRLNFPQNFLDKIGKVW
jgi:glycosyltransferase involved in cell wall biosynthesis